MRQMRLRPGLWLQFFIINNYNKLCISIIMSYYYGMRENHLCRVAGNTVWSRMTSDLTSALEVYIHDMRYTNWRILYFTLRVKENASFGIYNKDIVQGRI